MEQLRAQITLQRPHGLGQRRLGHVQSRRRTVEPPTVNNRKEILQLPNIHFVPSALEEINR
jgi:hypothetical protein